MTFKSDAREAAEKLFTIVKHPMRCDGSSREVITKQPKMEEAYLVGAEFGARRMVEELRIAEVGTLTTIF